MLYKPDATPLNNYTEMASQCNTDFLEQVMGAGSGSDWQPQVMGRPGRGKVQA